jgi:hypothetical protein
MTKIVISYRRADSLAIAGRIFDRLCLRFDKQSVFMDIDNIPAGADFRKNIDDALRAGDVMLVIIGRKWLDPLMDGHTTISDDRDWVRIEVETALAKGLAIIPVLVDGANMPGAEQLPPSLQDFAYRNAAVVDVGRDFDAHAERLVRSINRIAEASAEAKSAAPAPAAAPRKRSSALRVAAAVVLLCVAAGAVVLMRPAPRPEVRVEPTGNTSQPEVISPVIRELAPRERPPAVQSAEAKDRVPQPSPPPAQASPVTAATASSRPVGVEKIRRYVDEYDGGECFFVAPVAVSETAASLEGFGTSTRPFEALDSAFRRENGFEASIGVRQVTEPQCPAITFLRLLRLLPADRAFAPRVRIASATVRSGGTLDGTIDNLGNRPVELLLISDAGQVNNVSYALKEAVNGKTFAIGLRELDDSGSQPQLVMAVASIQAMSSLRLDKPVPADQFFPQVLKEAQQVALAVSATARYFKLEK